MAGPNNIRDRLSTANTSQRHGEVSPSTTLHEGHPLDILGPAQDISEPISSHGNAPQDGEDTSVLVVDWDGPDDPNNPKK